LQGVAAIIARVDSLSGHKIREKKEAEKAKELEG